MKCNNCGTKMINKSKGPYIHFVCPSCGNAITSYDYTRDDPIKFDEAVYGVKLTDKVISAKTLKLVSKISGLNYLQCKKNIENGDIAFSGKAIDIIEYLKTLKDNNVAFEMSPNFIYEIK